MCAMMPMLRVRSSGVVRAMGDLDGDLPAIVGEGLVGLRHAMRVFALLHRLAALVRGVDDLVGELLEHALAAAATRVLFDPAHGERRGALGPHLDRDLIGGAADAARL